MEEVDSLGEDEWLVSEWEQDQEAADDASQTAQTAYLRTVQRMLHHSDQTTENPCQVFVISFQSCNKHSLKAPLGLAVESEEMNILEFVPGYTCDAAMMLHSCTDCVYLMFGQCADVFFFLHLFSHNADEEVSKRKGKRRAAGRTW